ncbi:MAG: AraC family transcriptional regulator [Ruminococcus sp.]|nr:AraC family transcriptional regulator [Ruminococcus sp.]
MLIFAGTFNEIVLLSGKRKEMEAFWRVNKIRMEPDKVRPSHLEKDVADSKVEDWEEMALADEEQLSRNGGVQGGFDFLEANMERVLVRYSYAYLPDGDAMANMLYPIFISRWYMPSTHFTKRSGWKCYQLIYTHAGAGTLNTDHQIYQLKPNSLCLLDCRTYHYFYASGEEGWEYSFVHFAGNTADYLCGQIKKKGILYTNLKNTVIQKCYDGVVSFAEKGADVGTVNSSRVKNGADTFDVLFHGHLTALLMELARFKPTRSEMAVLAWLSEIQVYILENYNEEWNIHDLAVKSCLSDSRFAHAFKEIMGCTPLEYRDYLRIEHAKEYLRATEFSIEKICGLTGFLNMSNFYKKFCRHTGVTPAKYRKQNKA